MRHSNARHVRPPSAPSRTSRRLSALGLGVTAVAVASLAVAGPALAAKPAPTSSSSSLQLVLLNSTDGQAHYGQQVTFTVSTTQTATPYVTLNCYQNAGLVYSSTAGYFAAYKWPSAQTMTLSSQSWTGGAANCTATLWWPTGKRNVTGATLNFSAAA